MNRRSISAGVAFALVACSGTPAGNGDRDAGAGVEAGADAGAGVEAGADAGAGVDADAGADAGTGADASADADASPDAGAADASSSPFPPYLHGVTADDISNLTPLVTALSALPHRPTTRIVFDDGQPPSYYAQAVPAVHAVSNVLGEILDSEYVDGVTVAAYTQRTSDYLAAFPSGVDVWEVGNEINGNWVGANAGGTADVVAKMTGAFDLVKAAGGRTELTLYGCSDSDAAHDMFTWAKTYVPARMLTGLDYVLVSYYEGDCGSPRSDWPTVFHTLRQMFPTAGLGFGEVGAVDSNGKDVGNPAVAGPYLQKYYGMTIAEPGYVGGCFWWYFAEDMVPDTKPLFAVLAAAMK